MKSAKLHVPNEKWQITAMPVIYWLSSFFKDTKFVKLFSQKPFMTRWLTTGRIDVDTYGTVLLGNQCSSRTNNVWLYQSSWQNPQRWTKNLQALFGIALFTEKGQTPILMDCLFYSMTDLKDFHQLSFWSSKQTQDHVKFC